MDPSFDASAFTKSLTRGPLRPHPSGVRQLPLALAAAIAVNALFGFALAHVPTRGQRLVAQATARQAPVAAHPRHPDSLHTAHSASAPRYHAVAGNVYP